MCRRAAGNFLLCLAFLATTITAAPPQDNSAKAATPASLFQLLKDGYAALQAKDYEKARQASLQALTLDSKNQYAWSYVARAYEMLGQLPKAEEAYRTLIDINPQHASAYIALGIVCGKQGRTDEAIANYRKQLEITPRNRYALANLSRTLAIQRKWEEARQFAAKTAEIAPGEPRYWQFLGKTEIKTGHLEEARQSFDRALALPHETMLENNIAYELADAGLDLDRSWKLISGALAKTEGVLCEPEKLSDGDQCTPQLRQMATMLDTAGWVLYRQGKPKQAEPYLRSAFAITPRGEHELHMIALLAKLGRLEEAVGLFAEVREHPNFDLADSRETVHELATAAGGEDELSALLERGTLPVADATRRARVIALVEGDGRVTSVETSDRPLPGVAEVAKSLVLPALSWSAHSLRSVRTIELLGSGDQWSLAGSYVGTTPPPPPCGAARQLPVLVTERTTLGTTPAGCPADF